MRIDLLLKYLCLAKSRARAKALTQKRLITVNAKPAQPSSQVKPGDRILLELPGKTIEIELVEIPPKQVSKREAPSYYRLLLDKDRRPEELDKW